MKSKPLEITLKIFIEIPKGGKRRLHLSHDKSKILDLGPIKDVIPINEGIMPVAYGFIMGTLQKDESLINSDEIPDEIDALIYSNKDLKTGETISNMIPLCMLVREDGDHKVVVIDKKLKNKIKKWEDIPLKERDLIIKYFGYKSPVKSIEGKDKTISYINKNIIKFK